MDKLECDGYNFTKQLETLRNEIAALSNTSSTWTSMWINMIDPLFKFISKKCLHMHARHYHNIGGYEHDVGDESKTTCACILSSVNGDLETLSSEQSSFTDLRRTGMIFGRDFGFINVIDMPRFFKALHHPDFNRYSKQMQQNLIPYSKFLLESLDNVYRSEDQSCRPALFSLNDENLILTEFFRDEDLNDDGKVYGRDFIINGSDTPSQIEDINNENDLYDKDLECLTWEEYLETLYPEPEIMPCELPPFTKKEIVDELKNEFDAVQDINGDGLIYGKDFLILGDDKPPELMPYTPLYTPDIMVSWTAYSKLREYKQETDISKYITIFEQEYELNQDLDNNGIIYGHDFTIDESPFDELNIPSAGIVMTCREYAVTVQPYAETYALEENIQAAKFNTEYIEHVDIDGDGMIYGYDFILSDYEENKTECLWTHEQYRNMQLSWTPEKLATLNITHMINDYTQEEFDQYWGVDGGPYDTIDSTSMFECTCNPSQTPIIPVEFHSIDLSNHIVLWDGKYWYDLGEGDIIVYSGEHLNPNGDIIDLTGLNIDHSFDEFSRATIYHIMRLDSPSTVNPYVFKIGHDGRDRVYPSNRSGSVIDECLVIDETVISQTEALTVTKNYIILSDERSDKTNPIDKPDLTGFIIKWIYDTDINVGEWILTYYCERLLARVMYEETADADLYCSICVPMHKKSDKFNHFLPYIWNIAWNDIG